MTLYLGFLVFFYLHKCVPGDDVFTNTYCNVRFKRTFIDKTPLIYEIFRHKNLFISAPKKFGKSVNLGMLNMFLSNLRTQETIEEFFNGTEIWKDEVFVRERVGAYPVILFNVSVHGVIHDEDHMLTTFQWTLYNAFLDHSYLLKSPSISKESVIVLERYLNLKTSQCLDIKMVLKGLRFLAQMLYQHYKMRVIILADGFGSGVLERVLQDNNDLRYLSPMIVEWYNAMINFTFINQNVISHAVMAAESWLYGMTAPAIALFERVEFMKNEVFGRFFGFTYDELEYLLCKFDVPLEQRPRVLEWYCGYTSIDGQVKVCNPFSVLQYLDHPHKAIRPYWSGSSAAPDLLQRMVEKEVYQKHILDLVYGRPINVILGNITDGVDSLRRKVEDLSSNSKTFICGVLLEAGYLTYAQKPASKEAEVSLKFPNEEVRSVVDKFISLLSFI